MECTWGQMVVYMHTQLEQIICIHYLHMLETEVVLCILITVSTKLEEGVVYVIQKAWFSTIDHLLAVRMLSSADYSFKPTEGCR